MERTVTQYRRDCQSHCFEADLPDRAIPILADRWKIVQVLENLLGNAVKFSPKGSTVRVYCEALDGEFRVQVEDEGVGIKPEQAARVFDKFYRVDSSNTAREGLGLGLTIVKNIVEAHGGMIRLDSEPGRGTRVTFTIPRNTEG